MFPRPQFGESCGHRGDEGTVHETENQHTHTHNSKRSAHGCCRAPKGVGKLVLFDFSLIFFSYFPPMGRRPVPAGRGRPQPRRGRGRGGRRPGSGPRGMAGVPAGVPPRGPPVGVERDERVRGRERGGWTEGRGGRGGGRRGGRGRGRGGRPAGARSSGIERTPRPRRPIRCAPPQLQRPRRLVNPIQNNTFRIPLEKIKIKRVGGGAPGWPREWRARGQRRRRGPQRACRGREGREGHEGRERREKRGA